MRALAPRRNVACLRSNMYLPARRAMVDAAVASPNVSRPRALVPAARQLHRANRQLGQHPALLPTLQITRTPESRVSSAHAACGFRNAAHDGQRRANADARRSLLLLGARSTDSGRSPLKTLPLRELALPSKHEMCQPSAVLLTHPGPPSAAPPPVTSRTAADEVGPARADGASTATSLRPVAPRLGWSTASMITFETCAC